MILNNFLLLNMVQNFKELQEQISEILKENHQLKKELAIREKRPITETRKLLLAIIRELDELERDEKNEMSGVSPENRVFSISRDVYNTAKKPLLKILQQNKVVEMKEKMYELPEYVEVLEIKPNETINRTPQIVLKGYLYKGEILRKGSLK